MASLTAKSEIELLPRIFFFNALLILAFAIALPVFISAQSQVSSVSDRTIEIDDAPEMEVIALSKNVIIHKQAKAVFAFGGDVIVEGRVDGDVGVIGGNVIQKEGSYIGGDVIVFGGEYRSDSPEPNRASGKQTIVYGVFETELRSLAQDPTQLLSPSYTPAFFAQRILSVIFWFVVTLVFTTIAPGAVSRSIARMRLSTLKIAGLGLAGLIVSWIVVTMSVTLLPEYLATTTGLMIFVLLMLAYLFGRVTLHLSIGKLMQKHFFPGGKQPESIAILFGVLFWTILLSIPYVWTLALLALFAAGVGLVITGRNGTERL